MSFIVKEKMEKYIQDKRITITATDVLRKKVLQALKEEGIE